MKPKVKSLQSRLDYAVEKQDEYENNTINLIAADSATPFKYLHNLSYKHYAITEGLLDKRPYAGVAYFDDIEKIAVEAAIAVFGGDHANVQPHSGSQANQAVYQGLLGNNEKILSMSFHSGGHLTHGLHLNFSGRFFNFDFYDVNKKTGLIDYDNIEEKARKFKPKLIVCGASSYPRVIDFKRLRAICDMVGAYLMADISHPAGLIAANLFPQPFPFTDVITLTLDKTMRGPHGGIIICKDYLKNKIDKGVHPGTQSSVPLQRIYQVAQCLIDAKKESYKNYAVQVLKNIKIFESIFTTYPNLVVTGGTDTHMIVLDVYNNFGITGKDAEMLLESVGILSNRQVIPMETLKPYIASGLRLGSAWATSRGYKEEEFRQIAKIILELFNNPKDKKIQKKSLEKVKQLVSLEREGDVWRID